jgi:hypothetical protein
VARNSAYAPLASHECGETICSAFRLRDQFCAPNNSSGLVSAVLRSVPAAASAMPKRGDTVVDQAGNGGDVILDFLRVDVLAAADRLGQPAVRQPDRGAAGATTEPTSGALRQRFVPDRRRP